MSPLATTGIVSRSRMRPIGSQKIGGAYPASRVRPWIVIHAAPPSAAIAAFSSIESIVSQPSRILADTGTTAVVVDLDLLLLPFSLANALRAAVAELTGVPSEHVRVSATHAHSGPSLAPTWVKEGGDLIAPYVGSLPGIVAGNDPT